MQAEPLFWPWFWWLHFQQLSLLVKRLLCSSVSSPVTVFIYEFWCSLNIFCHAPQVSCGSLFYTHTLICRAVIQGFIAASKVYFNKSVKWQATVGKRDESVNHVCTWIILLWWAEPAMNTLLTRHTAGHSWEVQIKHVQLLFFSVTLLTWSCSDEAQRKMWRTQDTALITAFIWYIQ